MVWYEDEVKQLEAIVDGLPDRSGTIFYGSSSIRLWSSLEDDLPELSPINLGFGGSTMEACGWYFERLFRRVLPEAIILYAGDNDLGDGRSAEDVLHSFKRLLQLVQEKYGDIPLAFISIKPSISRWEIVDKIRQTNLLIRNEIQRRGGRLSYINIYDAMTDERGYPNEELLEPDGLHMNEKGYQLWTSVIKEYITSGTLSLGKQPI